MRPVILLLFSAMSVFAQPFSAGIKAGVPLTDFLHATQNGLSTFDVSTQRYIVGGQAELRLPMGLGVEFDALYRHLQLSGISGLFAGVNGSGGNWEFPLLLKYRFHAPIARP